MKVGQKLKLSSEFSFTGESCEVVVKDIKNGLVFIVYPDGYTEWLPTSVFI